MSYILDALRKAERSRNKASLSGLRLNPEQPIQRNNTKSWLNVIVIINLIVLILFYYLFIAQQQASKEPGLELTDGKQRAVTALAPVEPTPRLALEESQQPFLAESVSERVEYAEYEEYEEQQTEAATLVVADEFLVSEEPPLWQNLPAAIRAQLAPMNLDIHVYSEQAQKRFVLIDSVRYQQGDWLDSGPLLEAITETGVILNHNEQRFRLSVQR